MLPLLLLPLLTSWFLVARCQQWAGEVIPNSLEQRTGAEIAYFNIKDAAGGNTTLINYMSKPTTTGQRLNTTKVLRGVIVLNGQLRNANEYFSSVYGSLQKAMAKSPNASEETVAIIAPFFANGADKGKGYPWTDGLPAGEGSTSSALVWSGNGWGWGERNIYPHAQKTVSSYDVLDQITEWFNDETIFPNLNQVVVAGHSMGAQMNHRYTAIGKVLNLRRPVTHWIGNPNSYLWFDADRPEDTSTCPEYNDWKEGLLNYTQQYQRDFVQEGRDTGAVYERYQSRDTIIARGLLDHGDDGDNCGAATSGVDRYYRAINFIKAFPPDAGDMVDYEAGIAHDHWAMTSSESGQYRIILDNLTGNNSRHADFGARQVDGDNPHPNNT